MAALTLLAVIDKILFTYVSKEEYRHQLIDSVKDSVSTSNNQNANNPN